MFVKRILLFCFLSSSGYVYGQSDVCNAVLAILRDAPNKFRNIKGNEVGNNMNAISWDAGIKVPGSIGARFVASMGLFYECALVQGRKKEDITPVYEKYKDILNSCLLHEGYILSLQPNFYKGLEAYKKLVFMKELKPGENPVGAPAHVALEAIYSKEKEQYTIVLFIFEH